MHKSLILLLCLVFCSCKSRQPGVTSLTDGKSGSAAAAPAAGGGSAASGGSPTDSAGASASTGNTDQKNDPHALFAVKIDGKYGYMDRKGKLVLEAAYAGASRFAEGMAAVQLKKAGRVGFIDDTGKMLIPIQFDLADPFSEGLAAVMQDNKWGFIDKTGQIVIPTMYLNASRFSEGVAAIGGGTNVGAGYTYINKKGDIVLDPNIRFDMALPFSEGVAAVRTLGQNIRFIDHAGKTAIQPQFSGATEFAGGLAPVQVRSPEGMRWEYIGKDGKQAFKTYFYAAFPFTEGLAAVQVSTGKWGFINHQGTMVIDPKFDTVGAFYNGLAQVYVGEAFGYIDPTGKYVWEPRS